MFVSTNDTLNKAHVKYFWFDCSWMTSGSNVNIVEFSMSLCCLKITACSGWIHRCPRRSFSEPVFSLCTAPVCVCVVPLRVTHVFTFIIMHLFIRVHQRNAPVLVAHSSASFTFFILFRDKLHDVYGLIFLTDCTTTAACSMLWSGLNSASKQKTTLHARFLFKKMPLDWWFPCFQSHSSWEFHLNRDFIFARTHFWFLISINLQEV